MASIKPSRILRNQNSQSKLQPILEHHHSLYHAFLQSEWNLQQCFLILWKIIFNQLYSVNIIKLSSQGCDTRIINCLIPNIIHIKFTNLQSLHLGHSNIHTIQFFPKLYAPNLMGLSLAYNNIVSIRPLRKCNFKYLKSLWINFNFIVDIDCLTQMNLNQQLKSLIIDFPIDKRPQSYKINSIAKLQPSKIRHLNAESVNRIKNKSLGKQLACKYPQGHFR